MKVCEPVSKALTSGWATEGLQGPALAIVEGDRDGARCVSGFVLHMSPDGHDGDASSKESHRYVYIDWAQLHACGPLRAFRAQLWQLQV